MCIQFPLFFFKYSIGKYLSSCIISPGVVRTSVSVPFGHHWLAFIQREAERSQWQSSGTQPSRRPPPSFLFSIGRADRRRTQTSFLLSSRSGIQYKMPIHLTHYKCVSSYFSMHTELQYFEKKKKFNLFIIRYSITFLGTKL